MKNSLTGISCRAPTFLAGVLASFAAVSADFHAVGQEPDWQLDIDYASRQLDFTAAEGTGSYRFVKLGPDLTHGDIKAVTYRVVDDNHEMNVVVLEMFCQDRRSGKAYGATVNVRLDGREYVGCGEPVVERSTDPW